jgi:iron complex outermembrane receptor protein
MVLLSAGQALAQAAPAQNEEPSQVDEVIVTGFRASLANALNLKKNSNLIIESVTAEDMGKFPDQNIAESLQRLPGVQIDRENGQGTKVRIRGLDQNVTVLNNEIFVSGLEIFRLYEGKITQDNSLEGIPRS